MQASNRKNGCKNGCKNGVNEMAWIKAQDIAYGRLTAPDLDLMEEFLTRFGMSRVERTSTALYMRGTDPSHHIHVTEKGAPRSSSATSISFWAIASAARTLWW